VLVALPSHGKSSATDLDSPSHLLRRFGAGQASVVRIRGRTLRAFLRDRLARHIWVSSSSNEGKTWTTPVSTPLPNNNKAVEVEKLASGRLVIAFCNVQGKDRFSPLSIALSDDNGETWPYVRDLQVHAFGATHGKTELSYPSLAVSGKYIHITFTYSKPGANRMSIRHMCITEDWIMSGTPSRGWYKPGKESPQTAAALPPGTEAKVPLVAQPKVPPPKAARPSQSTPVSDVSEVPILNIDDFVGAELVSLNGTALLEKKQEAKQEVSQFVLDWS
ncbi:hypothetical protein CYMTET_34322, partial [Cymbomonas tetramitiformis]